MEETLDEPKGETSWRQFATDMADLYRPYAKQLAFAVCGAIVMQSLAFFEPYLLMKAVNRLSAHLVTGHRSLAFLVLGVFVTLALGLVVNIWQRRLSRYVIV
jgi:ABC-type multidrug transport system fused ATPase/permease subunit